MSHATLLLWMRARDLISYADDEGIEVYRVNNGRVDWDPHDLASMLLDGVRASELP